MILQLGEVLMIYFGKGINVLVDYFFNVDDVVNLLVDELVVYIISLLCFILDVVVMNGFDISGLVFLVYNFVGCMIDIYWLGVVVFVNGVGIVCIIVWDINIGDDFVVGEVCLFIMIGQLNLGLFQLVLNGMQIVIQVQLIVCLECSFIVMVIDDEFVVCGLYSDYINYVGDVVVINYGECVEIIIIVVDVYVIVDFNLLLEGSSGDFGNFIFILISLNGIEVELLCEICSLVIVFNFIFDGDFEFGDLILDNCLLLVMNEVYVFVGNIEVFNGELV